MAQWHPPLDTPPLFVGYVCDICNSSVIHFTDYSYTIIFTMQQEASTPTVKDLLQQIATLERQYVYNFYILLSWK
jgi:hypothetical protein